MNIVEDTIDRLPHHPDEDEAVNALSSFKYLLGSRMAGETQIPMKAVLNRAASTTLNHVADQKAKAAEAALIQGKINSVVNVQRSRKRMATKIRYHLELDTINEYSVRVNKDATPRDTTYILRRTDVTPPQVYKRSDQMAELARNYHNDLQNDESEQDMQIKDECIREVLDESGTLPVVDMSVLEKNIDEEDVIRSMRASAKRKAPGMDGIPMESWLALHERHQ
jgi:hypothetical protein